VASTCGICFQRTTGGGNLFSKRRGSLKYLKIKTFQKLSAILYAARVDEWTFKGFYSRKINCINKNGCDIQ